MKYMFWLDLACD